MHKTYGISSNKRPLNFETVRCGAYSKLGMNNIKCQNLVIFSFKIRMKQIFTINKPNIMKKSKYQQYFCFIVYILTSYAFWFSY